MLAVGRALMTNPKIMMFDEPSSGLAPKLVSMIFDTIERLRNKCMTILLVEQNIQEALSLADRAYVLETGKITLSSKREELINDERIKKAYLGL